MENIAFVALGSNIGDRFNYLKQAVVELDMNSSIEVLSVSSIYETEPVGYKEQASFLNMVIKVKTSLSAFVLMECLQEIETKFGRERDIYWGPRTLDLDILLYNQENIEAEQLKIPHPRMTERAFVMIPLMEVDRQLSIPNQSRSISNIIESLQDREGVKVWKQKDGEDVYELFES